MHPRRVPSVLSSSLNHNQPSNLPEQASPTEPTMSSPLSLSTANSLNRRPVRKEPSPLNALKNLPVADYTRLDRSGRAGSAGGVKREQEALNQHHGEGRAQRAPHQTGQTGQTGRVAQEPVKREQRSRPALDHDDGRITSYLDKIDVRFHNADCTMISSGMTVLTSLTGTLPT